ncbi:PREDICTED: SET and MYND domain-containing protein 4-like [Ceratosolen solmsi marchali]|uniref:Protein-lysine N-methyltransferase SMYD4 n=1 Tax=Ceratosolen solmsi marchali TaxID=326594 RepID=A0AAJ6VIY7_9HYME|nr:PREDICTED: SET and MYND domain-containing protein 4-like [Ceratosolen solmsi marchali]
MLPPEKLLSCLKLDGLIEELERKTDFELRIQITLQAIENVLPLDIECETKNTEEAKILKTNADRLFVKEKGRVKPLLQSFKLYSKSIAKAEASSAVIGQTYANRSAILFHLNKYDECIKDIDIALELNYPDHLKANLLRRKAKCLKILGNVEADDICEEARLWLENVCLSDEKKEKLEAKINNTTNECENLTSKLENYKTEQINLPQMISHPNIPSASNAIDIMYNKDLGKHLVANRDIDAGEILINEKPYTSFLSHQNIYTHCSYCFVRAWNSIPCEHCPLAMYCSKECRSRAWKQYHDIECPIKGYFLGMRMNELAPISLKLTVLAVRESGSIKELRKNLEQIDNCQDYLMKSYTGDGIYCSDKYKPLYNFVTHEDKRKSYEILTLSLNAAFILYYMFTLTSFFGNTEDKRISELYQNEDAMFIGKLLAQHFMSIQMNDHEFSELRNEEFCRIGSVIGSVTSLLNHSCNPNVSRCSVLNNNNMQQVVYALHPIKKGSEILDDYGCHFCYTSKSERDKLLKKYHIKCHCQSCTENWPLFDELPSILRIIDDKEEKVEVSRAIVRSKDQQRKVFEIGLDKYTGNKADILKSLANSIYILYQSTEAPSKEYFELLELFQQTFNQIYGYKFEL